MTRPVLLDLFCCAGGAAMGYYRAGFDVVGIDNKPQKHYPFMFEQADALEYARLHGHEFDAIHASPRTSALTSATSRLCAPMAPPRSTHRTTAGRPGQASPLIPPARGTYTDTSMSAVTGAARGTGRNDCAANARTSRARANSVKGKVSRSPSSFR